MSSLNFAISHEEFFLLCTLLKLQPCPGFDPKEFAKLSQYEFGLIMGTAERSLKARGYIQQGKPENVEVDPVLVAMIGTCGIADLSFYASCLEPERDPSICYYHIHHLSNTLVEHKIVGLDRHEFSSLANKQEIANRIIGVLKLSKQKKPACPSGRIQDEKLKKAMELIKGGKKGVSTLIEGGLDEKTAKEIHISMLKPLANGSFFRIDHEIDGVQGFALLDGLNGLWRLTPLDDNSWVSVEPTTGDDLAAQLQKVIVE